ncbi:MAG: hypothetical protein ACJAYC_002404 [Halieaceae bacterium]|jgi:hypothetical protein
MAIWHKLNAAYRTERGEKMDVQIEAPGRNAIASPTAFPSYHVASTSLLASDDRQRVERYIAGIFSAAYDAKVFEYLPLLCSLERENSLVGALGLRSAASGPLFCEQYLKVSVQSAILTEYGMPVARRNIMELGNLVSSSAGQGVYLYLLVTAALAAADVRYLVFAANRAVRYSIKRHGFDTRVICHADASRLGAKAEEWGSYYESDPKVVLADISQAAAHGRSDPAISEIWRRESHAIDALAEDIRHAMR